MSSKKLLEAPACGWGCGLIYSGIFSNVCNITHGIVVISFISKYI